MALAYYWIAARACKVDWASLGNKSPHDEPTNAQNDNKKALATF